MDAMRMQAPMLERRDFVRRLLIERGDLLVVSGLGSATWTSRRPAIMRSISMFGARWAAPP
jgi:hypothetical protein